MLTPPVSLHPLDRASVSGRVSFSGLEFFRTHPKEFLGGKTLYSAEVTVLPSCVTFLSSHRNR